MASPAELQQRGIEAHRAGRFDEAEACYRTLLQAHPHPAFLCNLGLALVGQRRHPEAVPLFERAIAARPDDANARVALANALIFSDRPAEALAICEAVLARDRGNADARHNRAVALRALNRHREAVAEWLALLATHPDDADAEFNLALSQLALGEFDAGWRHYEARWRGRGAHAALPLAHVPAWRPGTPLEGRAVLVQAEQGLGDTLHFVRWLPRGMALQADASLVPLLRRNLAGHAVIDLREAPGGFDLRLPLMSLPLARGLVAARLFHFEPYIAPDAARVAQWRARLAPAKRRWALAWRGRPTHRFDRQRSIPLQRLEGFLHASARAGIRVAAVQKDLTAQERELLAGHAHVDAPDAALADFEDTAAVLAQCERLVSVDTSVAHLAGAMGLPATLLLAFSPDFRWGVEGERSRFYPGLRLLRAAAPGDWSAPLAALAAETR